MKLLNALLPVVLIGAGLSATAGTNTYTATPNIAIAPDNGCIDDATGNGSGGITTTLAIPDSGTISDVNFRIEHAQTWRSDIQLAVTYTPQGGSESARVVLINNHDTSADNWFGTMDSDFAGGLCNTAAFCGGSPSTNCNVAPGPTCAPDNSIDVANFVGQSMPGTFTFYDCDRAAQDLGTLNVVEATIDGVITAAADVSLALADNPDPASEGGSLAYTATATNAGPDPATDVTITMQVPANLTFVNASGGTCTGTGPVSCAFAGATASGTSRVSTFNFTVNAGAAAATPVSASASVTSTGANDPNGANNSANASTAVVVGASADVSMISLVDNPDPVIEGGTLVYTATARNNGPSDAINLGINMPTPTNLTFVSASGGDCSGPPVTTCVFAGATASGTDRIATFTYTVNPGAAITSPVQGFASTANDIADPNMANNSANAQTVANIPPSVNLVMTLTAAPNPVPAGGQVTFTATIFNQGPSPANDVAAVVTLPAGLTFVSATPSGAGSCNAANPVNCTWAGATASGSSVNVAVVAQTPAGVTGTQNYNVTALASSASTEPVLADNSGAVILGVIGAAQSVPALNLLGLLMLVLTVGGVGFALSRRSA